jgi:hypothetical protein
MEILVEPADWEERTDEDVDIQTTIHNNEFTEDTIVRMNVLNSTVCKTITQVRKEATYKFRINEKRIAEGLEPIRFKIMQRLLTESLWKSKLIVP